MAQERANGASEIICGSVTPRPVCTHSKQTPGEVMHATEKLNCKIKAQFAPRNTAVE